MGVSVLGVDERFVARVIRVLLHYLFYSHTFASIADAQSIHIASNHVVLIWRLPLYAQRGGARATKRENENGEAKKNEEQWFHSFLCSALMTRNLIFCVLRMTSPRHIKTPKECAAAAVFFFLSVLLQFVRVMFAVCAKYFKTKANE